MDTKKNKSIEDLTSEVRAGAGAGELSMYNEARLVLVITSLMISFVSSLPQKQFFFSELDHGEAKENTTFLKSKASQIYKPALSFSKTNKKTKPNEI